ncbi:flagellar assembly protein FlgT [Aliiglaciecola litoralis]|uniref:Flagellar biosynthesis protein FlgT n=1 Tax=Aliiglaciecola litoralis TaxID=582857 RepID=A0ABN1LK57_9ALTE
MNRLSPIIKAKLAFGVVITLTMFWYSPANAAWFESTGQAAIHDGNIELARQNATQEAIKQALLFAGASVKSVQKMANGVLQDDDLIIRATGEVNTIELIAEQHMDGIVSVSIRADIFAQQQQCNATDYAKNLVTTWHPLRNKQQAATGGLYKLGHTIPEVLQRSFQSHAQHTALSKIMPFEYTDSDLTSYSEVTMLAKQSGTQYVLLGEISDISVSEIPPAAWQLWDKGTTVRQFGYKVSVYDGFTGAQLWQKQYAINAPWGFDTHSIVDVSSHQLWSSEYGKSIRKVMFDVVSDVDESLGCLPSYGRILQVQNEQLMVNIGSNHGVKSGDELRLFQISQMQDPRGKLHAKFNLHPTRVKIQTVYPDSAVAVSVDGSYLANIQANDFVSLN